MNLSTSPPCRKITSVSTVNRIVEERDDTLWWCRLCKRRKRGDIGEQHGHFSAFSAQANRGLVRCDLLGDGVGQEARQRTLYLCSARNFSFAVLQGLRHGGERVAQFFEFIAGLHPGSWLEVALCVRAGQAHQLLDGPRGPRGEPVACEQAERRKTQCAQEQELPDAGHDAVGQLGGRADEDQKLPLRQRAHGPHHRDPALRYKVCRQRDRRLKCARRKRQHAEEIAPCLV